MVFTDWNDPYSDWGDTGVSEAGWGKNEKTNQLNWSGSDSNWSSVVKAKVRNIANREMFGSSLPSMPLSLNYVMHSSIVCIQRRICGHLGVSYAQFLLLEIPLCEFRIPDMHTNTVITQQSTHCLAVGQTKLCKLGNTFSLYLGNNF